MTQAPPEATRKTAGPYVWILGVVALLGVGLFIFNSARNGGPESYWSKIDIVDKVFYGISAAVVVILAAWLGIRALLRRSGAKESGPDKTERDNP